MGGPLQEYVPILVGAFIALVFGVAVVVMSALLGPKRKSAVKSEPFACGNPPAGDARQPFSVKFYLVDLFFLVFNVGVLFILPLAVDYRRLLADPAHGLAVLVELLLFVAVLAVGLLYVWKRKALDW